MRKTRASGVEGGDDAGVAMLTMAVSEERDHILGKGKVMLVEYGDYECPHCHAAHFVLRDLMKGLAGKVRLVFRNFPLGEMHPHAVRAAEAAEAAAAQGKFWQMHDVLFERQQALEDEDLMGYARELGLDVERCGKEMAEGVYAGRVREDFRSGVRSGVNGTPTFFINGGRHDESWDLETLSAAIEAAG